MKKIIGLLVGVLISQSAFSMDRQMTADQLQQQLNEELCGVLNANFNNLNSLSVITELLSKGADVNTVVGGKTPLLLASENCFRYELAVFKLLLDRGAQVNTASELGYTPLIYVAQYDTEDVCRLFLDHGAQVNTASELGYTPLIMAASSGRVAISKLLLDRGAHVDAKLVNDKTEALNGETALVKAAANGHVAVCRLLLDREADVDANALESAAENGHVDVVRLLLDRGAPLEVNAALMTVKYGTQAGHVSVCRLLLERGFILPSVDSEELAASRERIKAFLMSLKRLENKAGFPQVPKDVRNYICITYLEKEIEILVTQLIITGWAHHIPKDFLGLKNRIIDAISQETFEKLKETISKVNPRDILRRDMRALFDPETLDRDTIKNNLIIFSQRRQEQLIEAI